MHVRPVRRGDHDAVLRLADRLKIGVARWRDEDAVAEAVGGWLRKSLADPSIDVLVAAAEAWAAERGHRCVTLETGAANTSARAFYASLGYLEEDVRLTRPLPAADRDEVVSRAP